MERVKKFFINDPAVIEMGNIYFKYVSFDAAFHRLSDIQQCLIGAGKTVLTMIADVLRLWGIES